MMTLDKRNDSGRNNFRSESTDKIIPQQKVIMKRSESDSRE